MTSNVCLLSERCGSLISHLSSSFLPVNFSDQGVSAGVIAGGVAGGVAATAVLVLCCIVFTVVYLRKRKQSVSIG